MTKQQNPLENPGVRDSSNRQQPFAGENHPFNGLTPQDGTARPAGGDQAALVFPDIYGGKQGATTEVPPPIQQAIQQGRPVHFSSSGENETANRQPDFFLTPDGKLVANPKAQPNPDGSINVEIQSKDAQNNKSLRDAIMHETEMQKQAAKEMIRLFQEQHPGQPAPSWMQDLANAKPNLPDFVPFPSEPNAPAAPPPENGFVNRGVGGGGGGEAGGGGGGGAGGFAGNGGFDSNGYFQGNGGAGDGTLQTGGMDSQGQPLGAGEQVQAKQIYDYLTQHYDLTPAQASGVLGNMQTESSFNTGAYNSGEGAIGLCQWEGNRRVELEKFAAGEGKPVTDWHAQVDFMMHELKTSEPQAWSALQASQTPAQAAAAFDQYYERSSGAARGQREANAVHIEQVVAHGN